MCPPFSLFPVQLRARIFLSPFCVVCAAYFFRLFFVFFFLSFLSISKSKQCISLHQNEEFGWFLAHHFAYISIFNCVFIFLSLCLFVFFLFRDDSFSFVCIGICGTACGYFLLCRHHRRRRCRLVPLPLPYAISLFNRFHSGKMKCNSRWKGNDGTRMRARSRLCICHKF